MTPLRQHEIAEAGHRILNPFTADKLRLLGEVCRLRHGTEILDLACGKGELLTTWAAAHGVTGTGVDISEVFLAAGRSRAAGLGVTDRVRFQLGDAARFEIRPEGYGVVSCLGATWIGGGLAGTIDLMRPGIGTDGLLLIGEPYWTVPPPPEAPDALGVGEDLFASLPGTLDRFTAAGLSLVEMVLADQDSWDRYVAAQWWTVDRWLRDHQHHPDADDMRGFLDDSRRSHLAYSRPYLGWGVFVLRPAG
jgi:SAM-dependent methyltransferase